MPTFDGTIFGFVCGDSLEIFRTVDVPEAIVAATLTVKASDRDSDADALIQKVVTPVLTADGQVSVAGSATTLAEVRFFLLEADTLRIARMDARYDIQVETTSGVFYTPEVGIIGGISEITRT